MIVCLCVSQMSQDMAIVTVKYQWELVCDLSNGAILTDPQPEISRLSYLSASTVAKIVQDIALLTMAD